MSLRGGRHAVDRPVAFTFSGSSPAERIEPVTLDYAKQHVRFLTTNEDQLIEGWIAAARALFEEYTGRQIIDATWEYALDHTPWRREIELPHTPLAGDVEVSYTDVDGNAQVFAASNYTVYPSFLGGSPQASIDPYCGPGRLVLNKDCSWPAISCTDESFRIRRTCGYGNTAAETPPIIVSILCLLIAHLHRNRAEVYEAKTRGGAQELPQGAKVMMLPFKYRAQPREPFEHHGYGIGYGYGYYPWAGSWFYDREY